MKQLTLEYVNKCMDELGLNHATEIPQEETPKGRWTTKRVGLAAVVGVALLGFVYAYQCKRNIDEIRQKRPAGELTKYNDGIVFMDRESDGHWKV